MTCYGINTAPIVRFESLMRKLPERQILELEPEAVEGFAREHDRILREIEKRFLAAFFTFLQILLAIATTRLKFPGSEKAQGFREFRRPFLRIYDRAMNRSMALLEQVLAEAFDKTPSLRVAFASELAATMVADEMATHVGVVGKPKSAAEADSHADAAIEVLDSVKAFVTSFVSKIPVIKHFKKKNVDHGMHVINEIAKIVFPGH